MVTPTLREAYEQQLLRNGHVRDPGQETTLLRLIDLQQRLLAANPEHAGWRRLFGAGKRVAGVKGLYLWGGVGRGKTFLMDLFYETLAVDRKRRIHFHRSMHDVHRRLKALDQVEDPLNAVAADLSRDVRVLCFDEFFVSDIGDAMILGRLLDGLFRRGVTLVTTSNSPPDLLYRDGLQRQRFLPAIDALKTHCDVVELAGDTDFRLRLIQKSGTYFVPADERADECLDRFFEDSASSRIIDRHLLSVNGRDISARRCAKGIAWFEFDELCDGPRSADDYIELARWYPTVIVSGVPVMTTRTDDQARRFIALVDEFYDRKVKLLLSAAAEPSGLYTGNRLAFEFDRTVSRLAEMQSADYLALPHLA